MNAKYQILVWHVLLKSHRIWKKLRGLWEPWVICHRSFAMRGIFSEKSDVYSFGVLVLEIISGKKNSSFCLLLDQEQSFLAYAWNLWNEGNGLAWVDDVLADSYSSLEVIRCVHIGLLCVQDNAADRPTMSDVFLMLNSKTDGPQPKEPVFTTMPGIRRQPQYESTSSTNDASITVIEGR